MGMKLALLCHRPILDSAWTRFNVNNRMARPEVNLVAPGPIAGARMNRVMRKRARATDRGESAVRESYVQATCLHRMVTTDEVVRGDFPCSPAAANITGAKHYGREYCTFSLSKFLADTPHDGLLSRSFRTGKQGT